MSFRIKKWIKRNRDFWVIKNENIIFWFADNIKVFISSDCFERDGWKKCWEFEWAVGNSYADFKIRHRKCKIVIILALLCVALFWVERNFNEQSLFCRTRQRLPCKICFLLSIWLSRQLNFPNFFFNIDRYENTVVSNMIKFSRDK